MQLLIKEIAKEKGITLSEVAELAGITQPSISRIVNGRITPTLDTLNNIAKALDVDISDLFKRKRNSVLICPYCNKSINVELKRK